MVDLSIERPNGWLIRKNILVVEVRPIKGKIDHPTFFKKWYFCDPNLLLRFGSQKYHNTRTFPCKKIVKKLLGNIFKTILKVIRWSKLPTFTVPINQTSVRCFTFHSGILIRSDRCRNRIFCLLIYFPYPRLFCLNVPEYTVLTSSGVFTFILLSSLRYWQRDG